MGRGCPTESSRLRQYRSLRRVLAVGLYLFTRDRFRANNPRKKRIKLGFLYQQFFSHLSPHILFFVFFGICLDSLIVFITRSNSDCGKSPKCSISLSTNRAFTT